MVPDMPAVKLDAARIPSAVRELLQSIAAAGGRAWLVGGTVRDLLLEREVRDFDVATDLLPAQVAALLPTADLQDAQFGACRVPLLDVPVVVTTLRQESSYGDHRRPDHVQFVRDVATDAVRRDFTCNAIYACGLDGTLVDPVGGIADLERRCLRMIGDPRKRLLEDPLRLLRLLRFSSRLGFDVESDTLAAAKELAPALVRLSPERVFTELTDTFTRAGRGRALHQMVQWGFAKVLLPEVAAMDGVPQPPQYHPEGCVLTHVAMVLDQVPEGDPVLSWSALLHDVGKPPTFRVAEDRIRFDGHDTLSASMAESVLERLHANKAMRQAVVEICRDHIRMASLLQMRPRRRERWLRDPLFEKHLQFHRADCMGSHGDLRIHDAVAAMVAALPPMREPLLTGADVLATGQVEGPVVGQLLRAVEQELDAIDGIEPSRAVALSILHRLVASRVKTDR